MPPLTLERLEHRDTPSAPDWGVPTSHTFGDFNGDGSQDIAYVAGPGGSVRVRLETLDRENAPAGAYLDEIVFDPVFRGGGRLATAFDRGAASTGDRLVVVPGDGGGPVMAVFAVAGQGGDAAPSLTYQKATPYPDEFRGGLWVGGADLDRDGRDEILLLPGAGGGPQLVALDALTLARRTSFYAGPPDDRGGGHRFHPTGGAVTFAGGLRGVVIDGPDGTARGWTFDGSPVDRIEL